MRFLLFIWVIISCGLPGYAQQVLLLIDNFETSPGSFVSDTFGFGANSGINSWIVNNQYDGQGVYPNTPGQDSTDQSLGTIAGAPFSNYLHIHDTANSQGIANASYNPSSPSDRFVYTSLGFCTQSLVDVTFDFFWICEGSNDAYGEVYYSANGGPWTQVGQTRYNNQSVWKFERITSVAFQDVSDLRFGFRWVNGSAGGNASVSFGIDDVIVTGRYDAVLNPLNLTTTAIPDTVCQMKLLEFILIISDAVCSGTYEVQLSNSSGVFAGSPRVLERYNIGDLSGPISVFIPALIPRNVPPGSCYKVRVNRVSPPPVVTGQASVCFVVKDCGNTILTEPVLVLSDPDTVCSQSAIDIPFWSTGAYQDGNQYIAQLSDSNGNFEVYDTLITPAYTIVEIIDTIITLPADTTFVYDTTFVPADTALINPTPSYQVINSTADDATYDPELVPNPGMVSGLVPVTPAGCNYYIRVVSTNPDVVGSKIGPFCIKHCDITTNETEDITICVFETVGVDTPVIVKIHSWDSTTTYFPGNTFQVELISMMPPWTIVSTGVLGVIPGTNSLVFTMSVPAGNFLPPPAPGNYYMRIVADSSSSPWNQNGTLIRLTIGAPFDNPPVLLYEPFICAGETMEFKIEEPTNPESTYFWFFGQGLQGRPPINEFPGVPPNSLFITTSPQTAVSQDYEVWVMEDNYGCSRGWTIETYEIHILPNVNITGPLQVCPGEDAQFSVPFTANTAYFWEPSSFITDTANNEVTFVFPEQGQQQISVTALNACTVPLGAFSTVHINVVPSFLVDAGEDITLCEGEETLLKATSTGAEKSLTTTFSNNANGEGAMFDIIALKDITISRFEGHFTSADTVTVLIYYKQGSFVGFENDNAAWTLAGSAIFLTNPTGIRTPIPVDVDVPVNAGNLYAFYITVTGGNVRQRMIRGTGVGNLYVSDSYLEFYEGSSVNYAFGSTFQERVWNGVIHYRTTDGLSYIWNTEEVSESIIVSPADTSLYTVTLSDTNNCFNADTVFVFVNDTPILTIPANDTICTGQSIQAIVEGADSVVWTPSNGLSNASISNPVATPDQSTEYMITGINLHNGCTTVKTWNITVEECPADVKVPQAFTPNGDGSNDYFTIFSKIELEEFNIKIFNRWGEMVYNSSKLDEINDLQKGWDGTHKGKPQSSGTFVYYIEGKTILKDEFSLQGNVTLVR